MDLAGIEVLGSLEERVAPRHTALLIVDMQNDYCSPGGASDRNGRDLSQIEAIVPSMARLIDSARQATVPIFFTKYTLGPGGAGLSGPEILRRGANFKGVESTIKGTWGHDLISGLPHDVATDVVIEKRRLSSFTGTDLDLLLSARGVKTIVIGGVVTQGCVESTARDAANYDYYVAVVEDCVASTDPEAHATALRSMATVLRYPEAVTTSDRIRAIWSSRR
ncbi:MAG TPA: isochorismatase family cysteine hydrolase [Chloroflexota bacterium]|nr:isochorismatase family cysteine hydrolase [Chloroflexota bacterium]